MGCPDTDLGVLGILYIWGSDPPDPSPHSISSMWGMGHCSCCTATEEPRPDTLSTQGTLPPTPAKFLRGKTSFLLNVATTGVCGSGYKASCYSSFLNCSSSSFPSNPHLLMVKGAGESPRTSGLVVQSLSLVQLFATPWTAQCQAFLSFTISQSLLKLMSIELMMPSSHLILC